MAELSMALAIMAILASVAALSLRSSVTHARLQQAVDRLTTDLILVRDQALRDQQTRTIVFNTTQRTYKAAGVTSLKGLKDIYVSLAGPEYAVSVLDLSIPDNNITFDFSGRCAYDTTITLQSGAQQRTIRVTAAGQVIAQTEYIEVSEEPNV